MTDYQKVSNTAIEKAKEFGVELDYSDKSIKKLELLLLGFQKQNLDAKILNNIAAYFGVYLGECLLKNKLISAGYNWRDANDDMPFLEDDNGNRIFPIDKVVKLLNNGSEDSLVSFYRGIPSLI